MRPLRRGTNLSRVAGFNEAVVIDAIRRARDGLSRVEVSQQTGLSTQTVSNIVRRMLAGGLLVEGERIVTRGLGKPRTPLTLAADGRYALGVHLDPVVTSVVLVNLRGEVAGHLHWPSAAQAGPDEVLDGIAERVPALIERAGVAEELVAGVGLAAPGPVDIGAGLIVDPPHLPRWRDVAVVDELERRLGLPVMLDKDVIAAAVGERWTGATLGSANSLFVYLSTGVGVGVVVDDAVLRGSTGNAGDIGHVIVDEQGAVCDCGHRGCLGRVLTPSALVERAVAVGLLGGVHLDAVRSAEPARVEESFATLGGLVDAGEPAAQALMDETATQLARAISTLANIFESTVVAIGGPTWIRLQDSLLPRLPDLVRAGLVGRAHGREVKVRGTALGADAIAVGAACLVLDRAFAPAVSAIALEH